jgi:hypothetical protein
MTYSLIMVRDEVLVVIWIPIREVSVKPRSSPSSDLVTKFGSLTIVQTASVKEGFLHHGFMGLVDSSPKRRDGH